MALAGVRCTRGVRGGQVGRLSLCCMRYIVNAHRWLLLATSLAAASQQHEPESSAPHRVITELECCGRIQGAISGSGNATVYQWHAIPYAAPPTAALRWRPPQPPAPWRPRTLDLTRTPAEPKCPQLLPVGGLPVFKGSEQHCLTLSVYAPAAPAPGGRLRPVMVWVPGGGFIEGGADE